MVEGAAGIGGGGASEELGVEGAAMHPLIAPDGKKESSR